MAAKRPNLWHLWGKDFTASLSVFIVALPLCLGIAHASDAPAMAGIIAGIVGGVVVASFSKSPLSVSGPAAGLTAIAASGIAELGDFRLFLLAVAIAGLLQLLLGLSRLGSISQMIPDTVVKAMLTAIGLLLVLKQLPHLLGWQEPLTDIPDKAPILLSPQTRQVHDTFTAWLFAGLPDISWAVVLTGCCTLAVIILWDKMPYRKLQRLPSTLAAVVVGLLVSSLFPPLQESLRVGLPQDPLKGLLAYNFQLPEVSEWYNPLLYQVAITLAIVASIESLLNVEAIDRLDPLERVTPPNRELMAQGAGNLVSGLMGGLPITSVIVRSSVNLNAGGRSRLSAMLHGLWLLAGVLWFSEYLNQIPLTVLAAILVYTGYKLVAPGSFWALWQAGRLRFIVFMLTVILIMLTDLLIGVLGGIVLFYICKWTLRPYWR
jgi:MFS superfamily sulfate permease-like transporter